MASSRTLLAAGAAAAAVVLVPLVLFPWLVCDSGAFGFDAKANCRIERLRQAPDPIRYGAALEQVRPLLDNSTSSFVLGRARDALLEGQARGYNGDTRDLVAWIDGVFAVRKAEALRLRDELEPAVLALRAPIASGLPADKFPLRATLILWEGGESVATYAVEQRGGAVTFSRGDGGFPRVYALPAEFRALYEAAKDGIGLEDWSGLMGLAGKVVVER